MTSPLFWKALRRRRKRAAGMPKSSIGTFCGAAGFGTHARSVISARSLAPGMVCREPRVRLGSFPVMQRSTRIGNRLLAALPPADFDLLAPHLKKVSLERDAVLVRSGDPTEQIYFPRSGTIAFIMEMPNGQTVATAVVGNEGAVGMLTSLGPSPSPTTAVVRVTGTAWQISPAQFRAELRHSGAIRRAVQIHSRALLAQFQHVAACNALHSVEARLARWLLHIHDRAHGDMLPLTQEALSELLGVRRTTVTQVVRKLRASGAIRSNRRSSIEIDRPRLEAAACECYNIMRARIDRIVASQEPGVHSPGPQEIRRAPAPLPVKAKDVPRHAGSRAAASSRPRNH